MNQDQSDVAEAQPENGTAKVSDVGIELFARLDLDILALSRVFVNRGWEDGLMV